MKKLLPVCVFVLASIQSLPVAAAEFLFIRHAESKTNAGMSTTIPEIYDPTLTANGERQAAELATHLSGLNVISLYTSAYQRTALTIAPTATEFGLTPTADARTNEWYFGDITAPSDLNIFAIAGVINAWDTGNTSARPDLPNAESLDDMLARVLPAWNEIISAHKNDDGVIVIVGHSLEMQFALPYLANNVSTNFAASHSIANTGIIEVRLDGNGSPYVANWQGTQLVPVPLPAGFTLLLSGLSLLAGSRLARRRQYRER